MLREVTRLTKGDMSKFQDKEKDKKEEIRDKNNEAFYRDFPGEKNEIQKPTKPINTGGNTVRGF